jgi:hypothetical protein
MTVFKLQKPLNAGGPEQQWLMYPQARQPQYFVPPRFVPGYLRTAANETGKVYVEASVTESGLVQWGDVKPPQDW